MSCHLLLVLQFVPTVETAAEIVEAILSLQSLVTPLSVSPSTLSPLRSEVVYHLETERAQTVVYGAFVRHSMSSNRFVSDSPTNEDRNDVLRYSVEWFETETNTVRECALSRSHRS
jgi:hypothetical protein